MHICVCVCVVWCVPSPSYYMFSAFGHRLLAWLIRLGSIFLVRKFQFSIKPLQLHLRHFLPGFTLVLLITPSHGTKLEALTALLYLLTELLPLACLNINHQHRLPFTLHWLVSLTCALFQKVRTTTSLLSRRRSVPNESLTFCVSMFVFFFQC